MAKSPSFTFKYHEKMTGRFASFFETHPSSDIRLNGRVCGMILYSKQSGMYYCQFLTKEDPQDKDNKTLKTVKLNLKHQNEKELRKIIKEKTKEILDFFVKRGDELSFYSED